MRENKLKFKKNKIASMSFLKGGGLTDLCTSGRPGCYDVPASAPGNACSDACYNNPTERPQFGNSGGKNECLGPCTE